jgi:hypothetical protein
MEQGGVVGELVRIARGLVGEASPAEVNAIRDALKGMGTAENLLSGVMDGMSYSRERDFALGMAQKKAKKELDAALGHLRVAMSKVVDAREGYFLMAGK